MNGFTGAAVATARPQGAVKSIKPRRYWTGEGAHGKIRITFGAVREISFACVIFRWEATHSGERRAFEPLDKTVQMLKLMLKKVLKSFKGGNVWGLEDRSPAREEDRENPWQKK